MAEQNGTNIGYIEEIQSVVIECVFPDKLPEIYNAIVAHWRLVSPRLVTAVGRAGGELFAWTVDDAARIRDLEAMGVTGVITNDPRLFNRETP